MSFFSSWSAVCAPAAALALVSLSSAARADQASSDQAAGFLASIAALAAAEVPRAASEVPVAFPSGSLALASAEPVRAPRFVDLATIGDQTCEAEITVEASGIPTDVRVTGCGPQLQGATMRAVLGWRFAPPEADGLPVRAVTTLEVDFASGESRPVAAPSTAVTPAS